MLVGKNVGVGWTFKLAMLVEGRQRKARYLRRVFPHGQSDHTRCWREERSGSGGE